MSEPTQNTETQTPTTDIDFTPEPTPPIQETTQPSEKLLAGKYKTTEELEKAYKELQTKLGSQQPEETTQTENAQQPEETTIAGLPASKYFKEYQETGTISEDSYKELNDKGIPKTLIDAYIAGQKAITDRQTALSETAQNQLIDYIGGQQEFDKMSAWANTGYTQTEKAAYTKAIDSGDPELAKMALDRLKTKYTQTFGHTDTLTQGSQTQDISGYKCTSDMINAMKDPRYGRDPDYTAEVQLKTSKMK